MEGRSLGQSSGGDGLWRMNSIDIIGSALKELLVARMAEREDLFPPQQRSAACSNLQEWAHSIHNTQAKHEGKTA